MASIPLAFMVTGIEGLVRFAVVALVLVTPRVLRVPGPVDAPFAVALVVAAWAGSAGWYDIAWWVDVAAHFVTTGTTAAASYVMLVQLGVLPSAGSRGRRNRGGAVLLVVALGLALGAVWEVYEWVGRNWLDNTSIHVGYDDTILDLTMDGAGSLAAGLLLVAALPGVLADPVDGGHSDQRAAMR